LLATEEDIFIARNEIFGHLGLDFPLRFLHPDGIPTSLGRLKFKLTLIAYVFSQGLADHFACNGLPSLFDDFADRGCDHGSIDSIQHRSVAAPFAIREKGVYDIDDALSLAIVPEIADICPGQNVQMLHHVRQVALRGSNRNSIALSCLRLLQVAGDDLLQCYLQLSSCVHAALGGIWGDEIPNGSGE
jgi:hypothetical protein